jgi:hypothetical protein
MTKQSETDDSQQNGNLSMTGPGDFQDTNVNGDSSTEGSTDLESDRLISKNI